MLYHPLAVAALVLKYGGNSAQAQAALLHDTICEPGVTWESLHSEFGEEVANLAFAFQDPAPSENTPQDWASQKRNYLAKVNSLPEPALLVILCEELHELTELVGDLKNRGHSTWKRYPVPDRDIAWYFRKIIEIAYQKRPTPDPLTLDLARLTRQLVQFVHEGAE